MTASRAVLTKISHWDSMGVGVKGLKMNVLTLKTIVLKESIR